MRGVLVCVLGITLMGTSCRKSGETPSNQAVQAAIERHLQKQSSLAINNMTLEVQDVKFQGERAEAEVKFRSKQAPDLTVGVRYILRRAGDQWEVQSSSVTSGMGGNPHGGRAAPPPTPPSSRMTPQASH